MNKNDKKFSLPTISLLSKGIDKNYITDKEGVETAKKIEYILKAFSSGADVTYIGQGTAGIKFTAVPELGVRIKDIMELDKDLQLHLSMQSEVILEAPTIEDPFIGIIIRNKENKIIRLRELIDTREFFMHTSNLTFAIAKADTGEIIVTDLNECSHLLISGSTASGKSTFICTIITSILFKARPDEVKFIFIDPKRSLEELYEIPHMLVSPIAEYKPSIRTLEWACEEMNRRHNIIGENGSKDVNEYNKKIENIQDGVRQKLPYIIIIVDELADLMYEDEERTEAAILRLAQCGHRAGIIMVIASQRPSGDVITGLIKANMPSRIAFKVESEKDSRLIIGEKGAGKLKGMGEMLFKAKCINRAIFAKSAIVSRDEIRKLTYYWNHAIPKADFENESEK